MAAEIIGWDLGGAHLKAAALNSAGCLRAVVQEVCPLWLGLDRLDAALDRVFAGLPEVARALHVVTMTGELADCFAGREEGVAALVAAMAARLDPDRLWVFAGHGGFVPAAAVGPEHTLTIASANWLASGLYAAAMVPEALFIDVGSTTTDILPICEHRVKNRGYTDYERMRYDELRYLGITRTPLIALAERVPLEGEWIGLMAEHFATTADVYRLTGELPEHADQHPAADQGDKTAAGSRRRLARLVGLDAAAASPESWHRVARFLRERQLGKLREGIELQLSRGLLGDRAPLVGAGVGRFLVLDLANRLRHPYLDFSDLFSMATTLSAFSAADCAPAAAVACLAAREVTHP